MDKEKEKEIEKLAFTLIGATSPLGVKDLTKQFDYKTVAEYLINAGYGNIKKAVREFAKKLKKLLYADPNYEMNIGQHIDNLITELYGADE